MNPENPLIVQGDSTLLLEVTNPLFKDARTVISAFAHLEKSPEYVHTYVITPLSLWNAASLGLSPDDVLTALNAFSRYDLPNNVVVDIREMMGRFGKLVLEGKPTGEGLCLRSTSPELLQRLSSHPKLAPFLRDRNDDGTVVVAPGNRGMIKQVLTSFGYPVHDRAGYVDGEPFDSSMRDFCLDGSKFHLREYQEQAVEGFLGNEALPGGSGVVVLPCGAGKTVVGLTAMARLKRRTLILVTNITAAHQWRREILNRTTVRDIDIGEYSGECKEIKPVTLATYQILTWRKDKNDDFVHYDIFNRENWGLIIYDEVHLLPAPVFKFTAELQARRRLGLTATLIREDGNEKDVFSLIGPKKFDMPWKVLEKQGWIATAHCVEIRVPLPTAEQMQYFSSEPRDQVRIAYENPNKIPVVQELLDNHKGDRILILAQYISQIERFAQEFQVPVITGATPNKKRDEIYDKFRTGEILVLILSKVGNFAIDLPDATVAIQVSGSFGSRQEEAQRLGRILRPKKNGEQATFYSIVTRESRELDFAMKRQLFLAEQGYPYDIRYHDGSAE